MQVPSQFGEPSVSDVRRK